MSDPTIGAKTLLVNANVGTFGATSGWGIYIGKLPSKPETAIAITASGGLAPNPKYLLDYPSLQVLVRGAKNGYTAARGKAQNVKDVLLGITSQTVDSNKWVQVNMIGDIAHMGFDENDCPLFSVNFSLIIEPATSTGTHRVAL